MKQINKNSKLIVISRRDLNIPGIQAAQSTHAAIQFIIDHPDISKEWHTKSNYLVLLSVKDENELYSFINKFNDCNILFSKFYEPDLNNQLTAIAIEPSDNAKRIVSNLPLLLKEYNKN